MLLNQEWVVSNADLCEQWSKYVEAERTRHESEIEERVVSFKISVSAPDPFCELQLFEDQVSQCQQAVAGHRDPAAPASESALSKVLQSFGWPLSEEELTELLLKAEDAQVFAVQDANTQGLEHMCGDETEYNWFTEIACEHAVHFYKAVDPAVDSLTKSQLNKSEAQYLLENNHSTVQDLKEAMASIYDAFPEELTIAYKGVTLENSDTLEGLGVAYRRSHEDKLGSEWFDDSISLKIEGPSRRKRIRDDRAQLLAVVKEDGLALRHGHKESRGDREVVMAAVQQNGSAIQYASKSLRGDREVVWVAVDKAPDAFRFASKELKADRELATMALGSKPAIAGAESGDSSFKNCSFSLRDDREFVLAAVQKDGEALEWASRKLQADFEIVFSALEQCVSQKPQEYAITLAKRMLTFASKDLQTDPECLSLMGVSKRQKRRKSLSDQRRDNQ